MPSARLGLRIVATPVLLLLLVLGMAAWMAACVARGSLLDPNFYLTALADNHAYDRIYSDVLDDPRSQEKVDDLLGGTKAVPPADAQRLLRQILPPDYLRRQSERNVRALAAYMRKDTNGLVLGVELGPVLNNVRPVAVEYAAKRLQAAEHQPAASYQAYAARLIEIGDGLQRGIIPDSVPAFELSTDERNATLGAILGTMPVTDDEKAAIAEALARADTVGALTAALDSLLRQRTDESLAAIRADLAPGDVLDLVGKAAASQDETEAEFLSGLEPSRNVVATVNTWGVILAPVAAVLATALLGLLYLPSRARALAVAGTALLFVGVLAGTGWWALRDVAPGHAHDAIIGDHSQSPDGERLLTADVARSLVRDSSASAWPPIAIVLVVGGALVGAACSRRITGRRNDQVPVVDDTAAAT